MIIFQLLFRKFMKNNISPLAIKLHNYKPTNQFKLDLLNSHVILDSQFIKELIRKNKEEKIYDNKNTTNLNTNTKNPTPDKEDFFIPVFYNPLVAPIAYFNILLISCFLFFILKKYQRKGYKFRKLNSLEKSFIYFLLFLFLFNRFKMNFTNFISLIEVNSKDFNKIRLTSMTNKVYNIKTEEIYLRQIEYNKINLILLGQNKDIIIYLNGSKILDPNMFNLVVCGYKIGGNI